jgi:hypothetical protein
MPILKKKAGNKKRMIKRALSARFMAKKTTKSNV